MGLEQPGCAASGGRRAPVAEPRDVGLLLRTALSDQVWVRAFCINRVKTLNRRKARVRAIWAGWAGKLGELDAVLTAVRKNKCFWRGSRNDRIVIHSCPFDRCLSIGV